MSGEGSVEEETSPVAFTTEIGHANTERITLRGADLTADLMGQASYTEVLLLAVTARRPSRAEVRVTDAVLVSLVDHGMQPSALASRITYSAAPDAVQGAIAAGLLGAGNSVLGSMDQAGRMLTAIDQEVALGTEESEAVSSAVDRLLAVGERIPGLGHRLHRHEDPRATRLLEIAAEEGIAEAESRRLRLAAEIAVERTGKRLPINATGAAAAILLAVGIPWKLQRGVAIISRAAGLLAHIGEEIERPITAEVRRALRNASWLGEL